MKWIIKISSLKQHIRSNLKIKDPGIELTTPKKKVLDQNQRDQQEKII